ncbi:feruloyl esterase A precursor [Lepidopterella palustris CBS 459.81]|uniref:Feruloyl esterase A n=1 Tax=Lepidopterella palustris CBS 459.81 TaxID=1314670 RepID=A0A8E2E9U0_9PEZI|nr:feruloyl esterase A precursor [Lepidopterella palustris CBS 459.81]
MSFLNVHTVQVVLLCLAPQAALATGPSVSTTFYNNFVRYTEFSAAAYANTCLNPPGSAVVSTYFDESSTDTQATLFRDDSSSELILAFRGTQDVKDFATDFDQTLVAYTSTGVSCDNCTVHEGYLGQWNSVSSAVLSAISSELSTHPTYNITVTGHSMGASLAVFASASLLGNGYNVTTYTFGQPRTGDPAFADYIDEILPEGKMYRCTHSNDGVPQTVTVADGYRHHKTEYWDNDPAGAGNTVQCTGDEPPDCNNSVLGTGLGANLTGINAAHLVYFGVVIGNPLDPGVTQCL